MFFTTRTIRITRTNSVRIVILLVIYKWWVSEHHHLKDDDHHLLSMMISNRSYLLEMVTWYSSFTEKWPGTSRWIFDGNHPPKPLQIPQDEAILGGRRGRHHVLPVHLQSHASGPQTACVEKGLERSGKSRGSGKGRFSSGKWEVNVILMWF